MPILCAAQAQDVSFVEQTSTYVTNTDNFCRTLFSQAYIAPVSFSTYGLFYKTPKIDYDRGIGHKAVLLLFAYGSKGCSEVSIDTLVEYKVDPSLIYCMMWATSLNPSHRHWDK